VLVRAICLSPALNTTAAVTGAEVAIPRGCTLTILVALVTDLPSFIAPVGVCGTVRLLLARLQTTVGERVTSKTVRAVRALHARDAAVPGRLAAPQAVGLAVRVAGTLHALPICTMSARRAGFLRAATGWFSSTSLITGGPASLGACTTDAGRVAAVASRSAVHGAARRGAARHGAARHGAPIRAAAARLRIELEPAIACRPEGDEPDNRPFCGETTSDTR
jgi:hypothetical protein